MDINLNVPWTPRNKQVFNFFIMIASLLAKLNNARWWFIDIITIITIDIITMLVGILPTLNIEAIQYSRRYHKEIIRPFFHWLSSINLSDTPTIYVDGSLIWIRVSEFVSELREFPMRFMPKVKYWNCPLASLVSCFITNRDKYVQDKM